MGSVEFHGFHLPLGTDSYITEMVASGIEKRLNAVVAPTVHLCPTGFAVSGPEQGTTDIDVELFVRWCRTLVSNYCRMGSKPPAMPIDVYYSVRRATTGSFLAALREGMMPAMRVSAMLMRISTTAAGSGRKARIVEMPVSA